MKKFLANVSLFSIIGFLFLILTGCISDILIEKLILPTNKVKALFNTETLIVGDSHTQTSLLPDIMPSCINISTSGENFYYTYSVLNTLLNQYKVSPDNVILGVSFHSFSRNMDKTLFEKEFCSEKFAKYFSIIDDCDLRTIIRLDKVFLTHCIVRKMHLLTLNKIKILVNGVIEPVKIETIPYCGSFYSSNNTKLNVELIDSAINLHYSTGDCFQSEIQMKYFSKIVDLCKTHNIILILLQTPVHELYFNRIPVKFTDMYYSEIKKYEDMEHVYFFDYSKYKLPDDFFGDSHHLNLNGAKCFSNIISSKLQEI